MTTTIFGDSCARELFKAVMRNLMDSTDARYLPRMNDSHEPNRERWGRQWGRDILSLPPSHPLRHYCYWRGCGVGSNFPVCGTPDRVVDGRISYASKAYIDTAGQLPQRTHAHAHPTMRYAIQVLVIIRPAVSSIRSTGIRLGPQGVALDESCGEYDAASSGPAPHLGLATCPLQQPGREREPRERHEQKGKGLDGAAQSHLADAEPTPVDDNRLGKRGRRWPPHLIE